MSNMSKWKKACIPFIFIIGATTVAGTTKTSVPTEGPIEVTMKDRKGRIQKFSKADSSEVAAIFTTPINEANAFEMKTRHINCKKIAKNTERQVNYLMELSFIIEALNDSETPILSDSHKETLSRIPLCEPYLLDLKIIAFQLNSLKFEKKERKDKDNSKKE